MGKPLLLLCTILLLHSPAKAACSAKELESGLTNYDGTIGDKYRIRLTLTAAQGRLAGVYVYATQLKDIHLNGSIAAGHLTLNELDAAGKPTGRFEGDFSSQDCSTAAGIRNSQELISQYDAIFTPAYRNLIADGIPHNMFVRDQGIMLGGGEAWFGPNGKVKALNN